MSRTGQKWKLKKTDVIDNLSGDNEICETCEYR